MIARRPLAGFMRKSIRLGTATIMVIGASSALAQPTAVDNVISQFYINQNNGLPDSCFDGRHPPKQSEIANGRARAEEAFNHYLSLAKSGESLVSSFIKEKHVRTWRHDGIAQTVDIARDPLAARIARTELSDLHMGNGKTSYRGVWRAYAADGTYVGSYEAFLYRTRNSARIIRLDVYSASAAIQPGPSAPFCSEPGDIEKWREAKTAREAEEAARRTANQAKREGGQR